MEYTMEELLPLAAKLTEKYTSKESSSVTYETAQMLMEAILYCIREFDTSSQTSVASQTPISAELAWQEGLKLVIDNVYKAKEIYEGLIEHFTDYGCRNYHDTILKGMPEFFLHYDPKFNPQNHIPTLDYPLIFGYPESCGIDLILEYLEGIRLEQSFLECFASRHICNLLETITPDYQELCMDNICEQVLFRALCCMIAEKPVYLLELTEEDMQNVIFFFESNSIEQIEIKLKHLTAILIKQLFSHRSSDAGTDTPDLDGDITETIAYLQSAAHNYAARICHLDVAGQMVF